MFTSLLRVALDIRTEAGTQELVNAESNLADVINGVLSGLMAISALMLLFYLAWAAIEWISAAGDSSKIQKARDKMFQSVVGLLLLVSALAIYATVRAFVGLEPVTLENKSASTGEGTSPSNSRNNNLNGLIQSIQGARITGGEKTK